MAYWDNGTEGVPKDQYLIPFDVSDTFIFRTGEAFWVIANGPLNIGGSVNSAPLNENEAAEINVHPGWNLITNPFTEPVNWNVVNFVNGLAQPLFSYDRGWSQVNQMEAFVGYYFYNPTVSGSAKSIIQIPALAMFYKPIPEITLEWKIDINLYAGDLKDECARIGIADAANTGMDQLDYRRPRALGPLPTVYFLRPEWDDKSPMFGSDIRPEINGLEIWDFKVLSPEGKESILSFNGAEDVPAGYEVYLIDKTRYRFINLREESVYRFKPAPQISNFEIAVGSANAIMEKISAVIPTEYGLGQNYPNPFNPTTTIPVTLPEKSDVTVKIFNLLGQEVFTLFDGPLDPGRHHFKWNGTNSVGSRLPSGIYLYQLTTNTGVRYSGKMVMIK
jgi:hypothetical protein